MTAGHDVRAGAAPPQEAAPGPADDPRSLGDILGDVVGDVGDLVKQELALATAELKQEATRAGRGAGMLGGAGLAGVLFLGFLSLTVVHVLDNWIAIELAALIVTAVWGIAAAVLALRGRSELKRTNPQLPRTQQTLQEDAAWARAQKS